MKPIHHSKFTLIILWMMILAFALYFSAYTIRRHETLHSYTADLSLIDQAMWNTLHGRFMEATWGDHQQPRTAEHLEPILIPLAALFWLWDDVRILLIAQAFVLAIGALPVFWLAKRELSTQNSLCATRYSLIFPALYLLAPPLQAAAVADFHADPFVVAPFLFAFWYATEKRWGRMWFWAIIIMLVKENMPTLAVMLGLFIIIQNSPFTIQNSRLTFHVSRKPAFTHGIFLSIAGITWFAVATFAIVAPLAKSYFATDTPIYLANRFSPDPLDWLPLLRDPARGRYLPGLLATTGGLALFAPQYLLLGLPIFIANTFSNFAGQYSGEQHYSAPLVAALMIAAVYGTKNAIRLARSVLRRSQFKIHCSQFAILLIAFTIALFYHTQMGWTPFSRRTETYTVTAHTRLLPRFTAQIPADAPVSASAAVHPHLAHRPIAYTFPTVQNAGFVLVDVTDVPGAHPNDVRTQLMSMLESGKWRLLDAADGFILLQKSPVDVPQSLPDAFFSFARAKNPAPQYPLNISFDNRIELLGYDILDAPFERQTRARLYWQATQLPLPADLRLWVQFYDDDGQPLNDPILQPVIEAVWLPPQKWRAGETVSATTLPANFGDDFHLAVAVVLGDNPSVRLPLSTGGNWATIASFRRDNWALQILPPTLPLSPLKNINLEFEGGLQLTGARLPPSPHPAAKPLTIVLRWKPAAPLPVNYTVFVHLVDAAGNTVAQHDGQPRWLFENLATRWQVGQSVLDAHSIVAPLPPGNYRVRVGLYDWQTLARLPLTDGADSVELGTIKIDPDDTD